MSKRTWDLVFRSVVATCLIAYGIEIVVFVIQAYQTDARSSLPWTFHTLWELAMLALIVWVCKRLRIRGAIVFASGMLGLIVVGLSTLFLPGIWKMFTPNYVGVSSRLTLDTHEEGRYGESQEYDSPLRAGNVYPLSCQTWKREAARMAQTNEYVATRGFLSWQTALASGFSPDPLCIQEYQGGKGMERLVLFLTVGPFVLVELFFKSLFWNVPVLLATMIGTTLWRKEFLFWTRRAQVQFLDGGELDEEG